MTYANTCGSLVVDPRILSPLLEPAGPMLTLFRELAAGASGTRQDLSISVIQEVHQAGNLRNPQGVYRSFH